MDGYGLVRAFHPDTNAGLSDQNRSRAGKWNPKFDKHPGDRLDPRVAGDSSVFRRDTD
jgi:hypothetical protein